MYYMAMLMYLLTEVTIRLLCFVHTPLCYFMHKLFVNIQLVPGIQYFNFSTFQVKNVKNAPVARRVKSMTVNFGPNHPAAHGILRLSLQLQGEVLQRVDPQFGFLHRGTEKLSEMRTYLQSLPYFDRFDYVANIFQEHAYCISVEALLALTHSYELCLGYTRTLFDELSRILNHLLTLSACALDIGSMGPIFWAFEERERIMEFFERISGARMHTALYKPYEFDWTTFSRSFFLDLSRFLMRCSRSLSGSFMGLLNSRVLKSRLASVGMLSQNKIVNYGISGIVARSSGLRKDLRLKKGNFYGAYWYLTFRSFMGKRGDNLDRFLIRIKETLESFRLVSQVVATLLLLTSSKTQSEGARVSGLGGTSNVGGSGFSSSDYLQFKDFERGKRLTAGSTHSSTYSALKNPSDTTAPTHN